ncbi:MAG: DUF2334 domain-containing protein [Candidatus Moranbacteria bacterium]|nr:DUF2334 domain-containing protein [Candidatus Moranbacteria bacterium]
MIRAMVTRHDKKKIFIIFRNDDLCALSDIETERHFFTLFKNTGISQVVGVIPKMVVNPHDCRVQEGRLVTENRAILDLLKTYHSSGLLEIAQHGFLHKTNRLHPSLPGFESENAAQSINGRWTPYAPANRDGYSEFNGLAESEQRNTITEGTKILEDAFQTKLQTFIFPWDRLNATALDILAETGFQHVLCSHTNVLHPRLFLLGYILRDHDIFQFPRWLEKNQDIQYPFLIQLTYHSWMFDKNDQQYLADLLSYVSKVPNIQCVTPSQIKTYIPEFKSYYQKHRQLFMNADQYKVNYSNVDRHRKIYVLNKFFYQRKELSQKIINFLISRVGLKRMTLGAAVIVFLGLVPGWFLPQWKGLFFFVISAFCLGCGFLIKKLETLKNKRLNQERTGTV